jgi:hypothetical protein
MLAAEEALYLKLFSAIEVSQSTTIVKKLKTRFDGE